MNERQRKILRLLLMHRGAYSRTADLAAETGVSSKTLFRDLDALQGELQRYGVRLEKKPNLCVRIQAESIEQLYSLTEEDNDQIQTAQERTEWVLRKILNADGWLRRDDLCEELHVSQPMLSESLKQVRQRMQAWDLVVAQKPYYGLKAEGREFNRRCCLTASYIDRIDQIEGWPGPQFSKEQKKELNSIARVVYEVLEDYGMTMSEVSVENLVMHLMTTVTRIRQGHILKSDRQMILFISGWAECAPAVDIADRLEKELHMSIPDEERTAIAIHLASKRIIRRPDENVHRVLSEEELEKVTDRILKKIHDTWNIDLEKDEQLKQSLTLHLVPLGVRLRYHLILRNPMIDDIRSHYPIAWDLAECAAEELEKIYGKTISDEETGYIALHLNLALMRKQENRLLKNVVVACGMGRGTSHMLAYQLRMEYGRYINKVSTAEINELPGMDFSDTDLLISCMHLPFSLPVSTVEVHYFLDEKDRLKIRASLDIESSFTMAPHICIHTNPLSEDENIKQKLQDACGSAEVWLNAVKNGCLLASGLNAGNQECILHVWFLERTMRLSMGKVDLVLLLIPSAVYDHKCATFVQEAVSFLHRPQLVRTVCRKKSRKALNNAFDEIEKELNFGNVHN